MAHIVIRRNAGVSTVTVDGREFDEAKMTKPERNKLRRMIVAAFTIDFNKARNGRQQRRRA